MQQPEVHLHPRAQAALGSFFSELTAHEDRIIVMETHSDYLVDRVRQEVAKGTIAADRVLIVFFHKPQLETIVYPINVDSHGNVEDAPPEYRDFFLKEELNLFSRTEALMCLIVDANFVSLVFAKSPIDDVKPVANALYERRARAFYGGKLAKEYARLRKLAQFVSRTRSGGDSSPISG